MTILSADAKRDARRIRSALVAILVVAFALRCIARIVAGDADFVADGYSFYWSAAEGIARGDGYMRNGVITGFRVPLYPLFLAGVSFGAPNFWAVLVAQSLVSTGTVACVAAIAQRLWGWRAALAAAAMTALYPYFVWHDTALQETGLFTFLTALATLLLMETASRGKPGVAAAAGVVLGLAVLTRSTLMVFVPLAFFWLAFARPAGLPGRRQLALAATALVLFCATLTPWLVRQHAVTGHWTLGTEVGRLLFAANNDATFSHYPRGSIDRSLDVAEQQISPADRKARSDRKGEVARDDWYAERAKAWIAAHPDRFVLGSLLKLAAGFSPVPSPRGGLSGDTVRTLAALPVLLLGALGMWWRRRQWRRDALFYAHVLAFAATTALFWAHSSHRAYLDALLIAFAAGPVVAICTAALARLRSAP